MSNGKFTEREILIPYSQGRELTEEGDILLFRGPSFISKAIGKITEGVHSHVATASWRGQDKESLLECVEFLEWNGGRTVSLRTQVAYKDWKIDVYRISSPVYKLKMNVNHMVISERLEYPGRAVTDTMRKMTGLPYGWRRIWEIAKVKMAGVRWLKKVNIDDEDTQIYPVCSSAVAYAVRKNYTDLIELRPDGLTSPADIARSPLTNYLFTYEKDWD